LVAAGIKTSNKNLGERKVPASFPKKIRTLGDNEGGETRKGHQKKTVWWPGCLSRIAESQCRKGNEEKKKRRQKSFVGAVNKKYSGGQQYHKMKKTGGKVGWEGSNPRFLTWETERKLASGNSGLKQTPAQSGTLTSVG